MADSDVSDYSVDLADFSGEMSDDDVLEDRELPELLQARDIQPYRFEPYMSETEEVDVSGDGAYMCDISKYFADL